MNSIKVALNSMRRNVAMTFASVILVFLTVLVLGVVTLISMNTAYASKGAVDNLTIYVRAIPEATDEQVAQLQKDIEATVDVNKIELETKEQALDKFANKLYKDNPQALLDLFGGDANPLSDEFKIQLVNGSKLDEASQKLSALPNVKDVGIGDSEATNNFIKFMHRVTAFSLIIALIMIVISIFIVTNTIKLTITARIEEIEIMRLVGATKGYVRTPFVWEGILFGLFGGGLAFIVLMGAYNFTMSFLAGSYGSTGDLFIPFNEIIAPLFVIVIVFGLVIGALGSFISTHKYLKK